MKKKLLIRMKGKARLNEPLGRHTTFGVGGPCRAWLEPRNETELKNILSFAKKRGVKFRLMGAGSNFLVRDRGYGGFVLKLASENFKKINAKGKTITAGAGVPLGRLIDFACKRGLKGLEGLAGIPGTLGGAIFMNASYRGSASEFIKNVKVMRINTGEILILPKSKIKFKYRHSGLDDYIILGATFFLKKAPKTNLLSEKERLVNEKKQKQPLGWRSAGCVFKNPEGRRAAAVYIDRCGLKGKTVGGAEVSAKHANFIVNRRNAKSADIMRLLGIIKRRVKSRFGIELEPEIEIL